MADALPFKNTNPYGPNRPYTGIARNFYENEYAHAMASAEVRAHLKITDDHMVQWGLTDLPGVGDIIYAQVDGLYDAVAATARAAQRHSRHSAQSAGLKP